MFTTSSRIKLSFTHFFYMIDYKNILIEYTSNEDGDRERENTQVFNWTRHHSIACEDVLSRTHLLFLPLEQYHYILTWIVNKRKKNDERGSFLFIVDCRSPSMTI